MGKKFSSILAKHRTYISRIFNLQMFNFKWEFELELISFCEQKYQGNIELLGNPEWIKGNAIQVYLSKEDFMRHEIQGGRKYYKQFRKESRDALQLKEPFRRHAELTLQQISKKVIMTDRKYQY